MVTLKKCFDCEKSLGIHVKRLRIGKHLFCDSCANRILNRYGGDEDVRKKEE